MKKGIMSLLLSVWVLSALFTSAAFADDQPADEQAVSQAAYEEGEILVKFRQGMPEKSKADLHRRNGATTLRDFKDLRIHHLALKKGQTVQEAIAAYQADPNVEYAEPNYMREAVAIPNDPQFTSLWGLNNTGQVVGSPGTTGTPGADIDAVRAWDTTKGSSSVVVTVIDTGVDYNHEDLAANMWPGYGTGFINNAPVSVMDDHGHGTHVAGTIGGKGNNGVGVTGVNWDVQIMGCKFLDQGGYGDDSDAIHCLEYVRTQKLSGVNIVATNNSWGGGGYSQALADAIKAQGDAGILFIAAAGNYSSDNDTSAFYPADYNLPNMIAVAATNNVDGKASFSNYGRRRVDVGAPGEGITSSMSAVNNYGITEKYATWSGTSMATPHVTGLAALLKAQNPARNWITIRNLILSSGDSLADLTDKTITGKRINAYNALNCTNRPVLSGLAFNPVIEAGVAMKLSALSINCGNAVGPVTVTAVSPSGNAVVSLLDNGTGADLVAGDGIFSATFTPADEAHVPWQFNFSSAAGTDTVLVPLNFVTDYLVPGVLTNQPYSYQMQASGGRKPYTWAILSGSLPPGLTMDSSGLITGTPTTGGRYSFWAQVTDSSTPTPQSIVRNFYMNIVDLPDLVVTAVSAPNARTGETVVVPVTIKNQGLAAVGTIRVGVYISADTMGTGETGIQKTITTGDINVGWADVYGGAAGDVTTININARIPETVSGGRYYIGAIADIYGWAAETDETNNSLAGNIIDIIGPDMTVSQVNVAPSYLQGIPGRARISDRVYIIDTVANSAGAGTTPLFYVGYYLSSTPACSATATVTKYRMVTTSIPPGGTDTAPPTAAFIDLPGTPGVHYICAIADYTNGVVEENETNNTKASGSISTMPIVTITSPVAGLTGSNPVLTYTVSDGTVVVKLDGAVVSKTSGSTLGPLAEGVHTVSVEATDTWGIKGTASVTFTVDSIAPTVSITAPANGSTIVDKSPVLTYTASDGTVLVRVDAGPFVSMASGSSLAALSNGSHTVTVQATDAAGNVGTATSAFTVNATPLSVSTSSLPNGTVGTAYPSQTLASSGGVPAYTWTIASGSLPAGLTLSSGGTISGTPTAAGTSSFTARVTDGNGDVATKALSITIAAPATSVAVLSNWTHLYSGAPNTTSRTNLAVGSAFTVPSGTNRLLLVAIVMETASGSNPTISAAYGGTALTEIKRTANTQKENVWMGYLKNGQIGTGSKQLTVSFSGATGNATGLHVKWAAFSGVNQTTPVYNSVAFSRTVVSAPFSVPFNTALNYVVNGMTTVVSGNIGSAATGAINNTAFTPGTSTQLNGHSSRPFITAKHTGAGTYASTTTVTWSGTAGSTSALVGVSLQP